jgi:DNA repair exonuclease SbcCD ATPase subunit
MSGEDEMAEQAYRVERLRIANFRGITEPRTIDVCGRHLFVLGPNNFGKSTIVEAIRWCLFGSPPGQQDIEVRNTFRPAENTEVVLELVTQDKILNICRSLPPGRSESRPIITDGGGKSLLFRYALPGLDHLGHPTGTLVIFAGQHAAERAQGQISDFSRVLNFHLGVQQIPDLLEKLRKLGEEHRIQREDMSKALDAFLQELRTQLFQLQASRGEIIKNPPWGKGQTPTKVETDRKIDSLFEETAGVVGIPIPTGLSLEDKISKIKGWNTQLASTKNQAFKKQLVEIQVKLVKTKMLGEWCSAISQLKDAEHAVAKLQDQQLQILAGRSLDDLPRELAIAELERTQDDLLSTIRREAAKYLETYKPSLCPVCNQATASGTIQLSGITSSSAARCEELKGRISDVERLDADLNVSRSNIGSLRNKIAAYVRDAEALTGKSSATPEDVKLLIENLTAAFQSVNNQIKDAQAEGDRRDRRIGDLEAEERFHNYQLKISVIENVLENDIAGARSSLKEYDSFLATVEEVAKLVLEAFDAQITASITPLAKDISGAYEQLTHHPSFDGVHIQLQPSNYEKLEPGKLELKVTSSKCPGRSFPANVLNGQAARALQLVPYFVFSDYWRNVMELDLLLVDDPSESFDTSHLDNLISVLRAVASHTQLIVASHETDRMTPLIKKYFSPEERRVVCVKDFDPLMGPTIELR